MIITWFKTTCNVAMMFEYQNFPVCAFSYLECLPFTIDIMRLGIGGIILQSCCLVLFGRRQRVGLLIRIRVVTTATYRRDLIWYGSRCEVLWHRTLQHHVTISCMLEHLVALNVLDVSDATKPVKCRAN